MSIQCLSIQIRQDDSFSLKEQNILNILQEIERFPEIEKITGEENWLILHFFTEERLKLWNELESKLFDHPEIGTKLKRTAVVGFENESGQIEILYEPQNES